MRRISILQIGDVHFPEFNGEVALDHKDEAAPPSLVSAISQNPLQQVVRRLRKRLDVLGEGTLIVQCGDMTSRGDLKGYEDCAAYLNAVLELDSRKAELLHAVPGNHDVDRSLCNQNDIFAKFEPLEQSWGRLGLPILKARGFRATRPQLAETELLAIGANSCVGSGERRYLPDDVRDMLAPLLDARASTGDVSPLEAVFEQLDTPAFHEDDLAGIEDELESVPSAHAAILVSHHPLLPQTVPRVEIYTEVINSGVARSRLAQAGYPVIYLHGHVHADPVEVLALGAGETGRLIMVAAPLLSAGFNELSLWLSDSGWAIGCEVTPWRREQDGAVRPRPSSRIPMQVTRREWISPLAIEYAQAIAHGDHYRFEEFRDMTNARAGAKRTRSVVGNALLEAEWAGYVTITDRDADYMRWIIERADW